MSLGVLKVGVMVQRYIVCPLMAPDMQDTVEIARRAVPFMVLVLVTKSWPHTPFL